MAHSPRGWTGARTPSAIKRVRQAERRRAINQPRRSAAKTLVSKALQAATDTVGTGADSAQEVQAAVQRAVSALDRAAKIGAIHKNAADRRKSRLMLKANAALGGEGIAAPAKSARQVGKAQAAKEAKARIAASRAVKAKGAQTAAGKARAALAKTSRAEGAAAAEAKAPTTSSTTTKAPAKPATKASSSKSSAAKGASAKAGTASTASASKASATKATASKATASKSASTRAAKSPAKKG